MNNPLFASFPSDAQHEALNRFQLIRPFLEEGIHLSDIACGHGVSLRTLRRWVASYRQYGLAGLCRKPRADKGTYRGLSSQMKTLIEAYALQQPKLSVRAIHRNLHTLAENHRQNIPSYRTVAKVVASIDNGLMTLAHEGSEVYSQAFDLLYRHESDTPNAVWQADHSVLDILVLDEQKTAKKPWLTIILDDYSRAIAGYFLSFQSPCATHTALALRQAIWHKSHPGWQICGIPAMLYTDHGSDFTSRHIEQVAADLSIRLIFSQVGKPRGRGKIERFFQTLSQLLLCHLPGYAPPKSQRPAKSSMTLDELDKEVQTFIVEQYLVQPHSTTGVPPAQRWEGNGFLPQTPESLQQLDLLLLNVAKPRRIHRDGIRLFGFRYTSPTLAAFIGDEVTIRYDPSTEGLKSVTP